MSYCFFRLAGYFVTPGLFIVLLTTAPDHFAERPELIISEETTVFLGPVRDDGTINYVAAWNAKFSEGVTPENNAAAALFKLMRRPLENEAFDRRLAAMFGVDPAMDPRMVTPWSSDPGVKAQFDKAQRGPWQAGDLPRVAQWLRANQPGLDAVADAVALPAYWWPMMCGEGEREGLIGSLDPHLEEARFLARSLRIRGFNRISNRDLEGAVADFRTMQKLGRLIGTEPVVLYRLVDCSIHLMAQELAEHILVEPALTRADASRIYEATHAARPIDYFGEAIGFGDRLMALDFFVHIHAGIYTEWAPVLPLNRVAIRSSAFDINEALRFVSHWHLQMAEVVPETIAASSTAANALNERMENLPRWPAPAQDDAGHPRQFSQAVATRVWFGWITSPHAHTSLTFDIGHAERLRVAAALTLHRIDHGLYPQQLNALVPHYLEELPTDRYDGRPLTYKPSEDGKTYLLYSVGPDGEDDGGLDDLTDGDRVIGDPVPESE
ncbi:MAG: hypothetical protein AAF797_06155 [Planctomycetota bacterium]